MNIAKQRIHNVTALLQERMVRFTFPITDIQSHAGTVIAVEDESKREYLPFEKPYEWGGRDIYRTFFMRVVLPPEAQGLDCAVEVITGRESEWEQQGVNPQFLVWVNGTLRQGMDVNHRQITLSQCGKGSDIYEIVAEGWSGLQDGVCLFVPTLQLTDQRIESLYYTFSLLQMTADMEGQDKDESDRLYRELCNAANMLELRDAADDKLAESAARANNYLKQQVLDRGGKSDALLSCIGSTHIDIAWLWRVRHTRKKAARSFLNALSLMERYPEYRFMMSSPILFEFLRDDYPELYSRIRKAIADGRIDAEGGMWLEADCNLTSGEALIRQFLYGKRFFKDELGVDSKLLWLPDVFGYSAALPQIMKKCGINYFITSKLSWNDTNRIPNDTFYWEGIDGSRVLTYFLTMPEESPVDGFNPWYSLYAGYIHPATVAGAWSNYQNKQLSREVFATFGYGDGGGGSVREDCEFVRRLDKGLPGVPAVSIDTPLAFMDRLAQRQRALGDAAPSWLGELYFEFHRGTLTTMADNKKNNRKGEFILRSLELALTRSSIDDKTAYPHTELERLWKLLMLNQFHDILPGSSIREVYEDSREDYISLFAQAEKLLAYVRGGKATQGEQRVTVWNDHAWTRSGLVCLPPDWAGYLADGHIVQKAGDGAICFVERVPSMGSRVLTRGERASDEGNGLTVTSGLLENTFFRVNVNAEGGITSFYDKRIGRELVRTGQICNRLAAYEDLPYANDAWDICKYYREKEYCFRKETVLTVEETGPVRGCLKVERVLGTSRITQRYYIYSDVARLDFATEVDWVERHTLLKAVFPVNVHANEATYDIQFGNITRPTHNNTSWQQAQFEVCAHRWSDLSQADMGVSLLNDCKYGHCIKNGVMELTLLRGSTAPNESADLGSHSFTYSMYPHLLGWREGAVPAQALDINDPLTVTAEEREQPAFVNVNARNVAIEAVKCAEDGEEIILRLNEFENAYTELTLSLYRPVVAAWECDMLEEKQQALQAEGTQLHVKISPYEVKTLRIILNV